MLLFATPHKGMVVNDMQKMLMGQNDHPRHVLLNQINQESDLLNHQLDTFRNIIRDRKIVSFYERGQTRQLEYVSCKIKSKTKQPCERIADNTTTEQRKKALAEDRRVCHGIGHRLGSAAAPRLCGGEDPFERRSLDDC
jgi:hypothetical protein